jgi:Tfp pilus assembly protein PilN
MKHINLAIKPSYFPLSKKIQIRISIGLFAILICYFALKILYLNLKMREIANEITILNNDIIKLREMVNQSQQILELKKSIEKEFSVSIDQKMITNHSLVSDLFNSLSEITPDNVWITSLEIKYDDEKFLRISGKSKTKTDVFVFMENLRKKYNDVNLINMQAEENGIFSFNLRLDKI